ncbi:hypothetical protein HNO88_002295 [Novosphingobium chloroacetimidivorans]|uniref:Uncharacterized protein n=1 Tax=Novosphingobium chloroacetimidivorans TaxID=1428314 RepID=A0A7W7KB06_9SPHN|nr:hypothetical protein [Novosphingobium chloroacetimidivorans]MBB4858969.1 hypothetical protein [Novosphingobium chloroacetimidivorans]
MRVLAALALGLFASASAAGPPARPVRIGGIEARLFYQTSGKLSDDLLARKEPFVGWNTVIGEGPVDDAASDLLVDVKLTGSGVDEQSVDDPLEIWVTDKAGKTLAKRTITNLLVPYQGALHNALWLRDVGCAGKLTFHARFRMQVKTAALSLDCGE